MKLKDAPKGTTFVKVYNGGRTNGVIPFIVTEQKGCIPHCEGFVACINLINGELCRLLEDQIIAPNKLVFK